MNKQIVPLKNWSIIITFSINSHLSAYFRGVIHTSKEIYFIEPTSSVISEPHIIFRESDRKPTEEHCGKIILIKGGGV